jgi:hypothetical protein
LASRKVRGAFELIAVVSRSESFAKGKTKRGTKEKTITKKAVTTRSRRSEILVSWILRERSEETRTKLCWGWMQSSRVAGSTVTGLEKKEIRIG